MRRAVIDGSGVVCRFRAQGQYLSCGGLLACDRYDTGGASCCGLDVARGGG